MNPTIILAALGLYFFTRKPVAAGAGLLPTMPTQPKPDTAKPPASGAGGGGVGSGAPGAGGAKTSTINNGYPGDPFAPVILGGDVPNINLDNPDDFSGINAPDPGYIDYLTQEYAQEGNALGDALALTPTPNVVLAPQDDNSYVGDLGGYGDGYDYTDDYSDYYS